MTHFEDCLKRNGLGDMLEREFGRFGHFSQQAAEIILEVSDLESVSPELLAYSWVKESCFVLNPMPNTNNKPENPYAWDFGPGQINMGWCFKSIWVKEYSAEGLHYDQVFGKQFYLAAAIGLVPGYFTGSPLANLRMASRRLLARKGDDEEKATLYPGPKARDDRREGWKKYGELMKNFFKIYVEGK